MTAIDADRLIRGLIGGQAAAAVEIVGRAQTCEDPVVVTAAALIDPGAPELLARGAELAQTSRERQVVAIATAYLAGDGDLVDALVRTTSSTILPTAALSDTSASIASPRRPSASISRATACASAALS